MSEIDWVKVRDRLFERAELMNRITGAAERAWLLRELADALTAGIGTPPIFAAKPFYCRQCGKTVVAPCGTYCEMRITFEAEKGRSARTGIQKDDPPLSSPASGCRR